MAIIRSHPDPATGYVRPRGKPSSSGSPPGGLNFIEYEFNDMSARMSIEDACLLARAADKLTPGTCDELYGMRPFSKSRDVMQQRWELDGARAQEGYARSGECD